MKTKAIFTSLCALSLVLLSSLSAAQRKAPPVTVDGLKLVGDTELALVYVQPGVEMSRYNRIYLADAYVAFKKNWKRDQNRSVAHKIKSGDMDRIRVELAAMFRDVFTETLQQGGYQLVTERAQDVLLIKPAIINLDVIAPDTTMSSVNVHSYAETAGEMTLYLELYDAVTDDIIARALDRQMDRKTGYFQWQNRIMNRAAAKRILTVWANVLKQGLDEARASGGN